MVFQNREEAARRLVERLTTYRAEHPLILAVPRGAVPMGRIIADALGGELDVVLVHKIGAPGNPEFAIGAVDETGHYELTEQAAGFGIDHSYIEREVAAQLANLKARRGRYTPVRPPIEPGGRVVIVVDDGVATGATLLAALRALREKQPKRLIAAVGVAPADAVARIRAAADETIVLDTPEPFYAVGWFFSEFPQISDEEVIGLLSEAPHQQANRGGTP